MTQQTTTGKRTKQDRLIAITDAYLKTSFKTEWTTREIANWTMRNGLFPVPGMREAIEHHTRWNERFAQVTGNLGW